MTSDQNTITTLNIIPILHASQDDHKAEVPFVH